MRAAVAVDGIGHLRRRHVDFLDDPRLRHSQLVVGEILLVEHGVGGRAMHDTIRDSTQIRVSEPVEEAVEHSPPQRRELLGVELQELVVPRVHDHDVGFVATQRVRDDQLHLSRSEGDDSQICDLDGPIGSRLAQHELQVPGEGRVRAVTEPRRGGAADGDDPESILGLLEQDRLVGEPNVGGSPHAGAVGALPGLEEGQVDLLIFQPGGRARIDVPQAGQSESDLDRPEDETGREGRRGQQGQIRPQTRGLRLGHGA
jgi:hypothetical protein